MATREALSRRSSSRSRRRSCRSIGVVGPVTCCRIAESMVGEGGRGGGLVVCSVG